jgi:serine/threonine protein kinase
MDILQIACPKCDKRYKVPADHVGQKAKCHCGCVWVVAKPSDAPAEAVPPKAAPAKPTPAKATPAGVAKPIDDSAVKPEGPSKPTKAVKSKGKLSREEEEARELIDRDLGSFRIEELLGIGGFGAVYRAFDRSLHRRVALKVLPHALAKAGKERIQRFLHEARAAAKLSHPNIVAVHQICQVDGIYFIVMELVDGQSLAQLIRTHRLSPQRATHIITEAARGLAQAHRRGLIHRDIKPGNIMVTTDGQVKMTDFGLARDVFREAAEAESGRAVGTPLYMAPEQCDGDEGDSRSDIYSLAGTYYVALTRRPPYEGQSTEEVMDRHRFDPSPDPRTIIPGLPAAVFRIIEKAMAKDPAERYQTAGEMLTALEALDFETLDPSTAVTLEKVSAQIGGVTPDVGSHVGAVMRSAIRRADRSTTRSAARQTSDPGSPLKWWLLVAVLVALVSITAIVLAIVLSKSAEPESATSHASSSSEQPTTRGDAPGDKPNGGDPTTPPTDTAGETPKDDDPKPAAGVNGEKPVEPPKDEPTPENENEKIAMQRYETAAAYEKSSWATNPSRVEEVYREITRYFPGTKAATLAEQALKRLLEGEEAPVEDDMPADNGDEVDTPTDNGGNGEAPSETDGKTEENATP